MINSQWEVMPDEGERLLGEISKDVIRWNKFGGNLQPLRDIVDNLGSVALDQADDVVEPFFNDKVQNPNIETVVDLDKFMESIDPKIIDTFVKDRIAESALELVEAIRHGRTFGLEDKKARLTVIDDGVTLAKSDRHGTNMHGLSKFKGMVELDTVFEGRIKELASLPTAGGRLVLQNLQNKKFYNLVDRQYGLARVKLEIFSKREVF